MARDHSGESNSEPATPEPLDNPATTESVSYLLENHALQMTDEVRPLADLDTGDDLPESLDRLRAGNQVFDEHGRWNPIVGEGARLSDFEESPDGLEGIWDLPEYQPWEGLPDQSDASGTGNDRPVAVTTAEGHPLDYNPAESNAERGRVPDQVGSGRGTHRPGTRRDR